MSTSATIHSPNKKSKWILLIVGFIILISGTAITLALLYKFKVFGGSGVGDGDTPDKNKKPDESKPPSLQEIDYNKTTDELKDEERNLLIGASTPPDQSPSPVYAELKNFRDIDREFSKITPEECQMLLKCPNSDFVLLCKELAPNSQDDRASIGNKLVNLRSNCGLRQTAMLSVKSGEMLDETKLSKFEEMTKYIYEEDLDAFKKFIDDNRKSLSATDVKPEPITPKSEVPLDSVKNLKGEQEEQLPKPGKSATETLSIASSEGLQSDDIQKASTKTSHQDESKRPEIVPTDTPIHREETPLKDVTELTGGTSISAKKSELESGVETDVNVVKFVEPPHIVPIKEEGGIGQIEVTMEEDKYKDKKEKIEDEDKLHIILKSADMDLPPVGRIKAKPTKADKDIKSAYTDQPSLGKGKIRPTRDFKNLKHDSIVIKNEEKQPEKKEVVPQSSSASDEYSDGIPEPLVQDNIGESSSSDEEEEGLGFKEKTSKKVGEKIDKVNKLITTLGGKISHKTATVEYNQNLFVEIKKKLDERLDSADFKQEDKFNNQTDGIKKRRKVLKDNNSEELDEYRKKSNNELGVKNEEITNDVRKRIHILKDQDLLKLKVPAVVNAANKRCLGGGGLDGAFHEAFDKSYDKDSRHLSILSRYIKRKLLPRDPRPGKFRPSQTHTHPRIRCPEGTVRVIRVPVPDPQKEPKVQTDERKKLNPYIQFIFQASPKQKTEFKKDPASLGQIYYSIMERAEGLEVKQIGIPAIGTGVFGYSYKSSTIIALYSVHKWFLEHPKSEIEVFFVFKGDDTDSLVDLYKIYIDKIFPKKPD